VKVGREPEAGRPEAGTFRVTDALLWFALAAAPFAVFWPATLGRIVLANSDAMVHAFPLRMIATRMALSGTLPLWNPWAFSGFPLFAETQAALLYPGTWLFAILPPTAAVNLLMISSYSIAILGTFALAREIGCSRTGSAFAGLTFGMSGWMLAHLPHTSAVHGMAWLPWFLLSMERLRHRATLLPALGAAGALTLVIFSGHPPVLFYVLIAGGLYVLFFTVVGPAVGRGRYALAAAASVVLALLLGSVQLVPAAELARQSVRAGISFEDFVSFSLPPSHLPMLLFPYLFGGRSGAPYWGERGGPWELMGYAGIGATMLAAAAALLARRHRHALFFTATAALGLTLALGDHTPLARLLYQVPVYNLFRAPARNLYLFDFSVAMLSGLALTYCGPDRRRLLLTGGLGVGSAVAAIAGAVSLAGPRIWGELAARTTPGGLAGETLRGTFSLSNPAIAFPVGLSLAALVLISVRTGRWPALGACCLVGLQAADIYVFNQWWPNVFPASEEAWQRPGYIRRINALEPDPSSFRIAVFVAGAHLPPSQATGLWNVPTINGYDPLMISRYGAVAGGMDYAGVIPEGVLLGNPVFLDLLNARYVLALYSPDTDSSLWLGPIRLATQGLSLSLRSGDRVPFAFSPSVRTTHIGLASYLSLSVDVPDDSEVARLIVTGLDGRAIETPIRAGTHTAEWAWDRPDVAGRVAHRRGLILRDLGQGSESGHVYGATIDLGEPIEVTQVSIARTGTGGLLNLSQLSLYDASSGRSTPVTLLHSLARDGERWRTVFREGDAELLENRRALPRAWLVPEAARLTSAEVLAAVRDGRLPNGRTFDPRAMALVEDQAGMAPRPLAPGASAKIVRYEPNRLEVAVKTATPAMLVLSESWYPGWKAEIDDRPAPVERVDYVLRGVRLEGGEHRVRLRFEPLSVTLGFAVSALTALAVASAALVEVRRRRG
jgi:Bacterial membrane protein YfhO